MAATPGIDQPRAARQPGKGGGVEDAGGLGGQRQQADEDLTAGQDGVEPGRPGITRKPGDLHRPAAPAGDIEAERPKLLPGILAERAKAENAYGALGGVLLLALGP